MENIEPIFKEGKPMKIFILEDDKERIKEFASMFEEQILVIANDSDVANSILYYNKFDLIFLDHDLEGKQMCESEGNTGFKVASHIGKSENFRTNIVIHSYNMKGANNILKVLSEDINFKGKAIILPFGTFNKNIIYNIGTIINGSENKTPILSGERL